MENDVFLFILGTIIGITVALLYSEIKFRLRIRKAEKAAIERSRVVLKGRLAEQMAPYLPGFQYNPADARFLGDPIDYIVFNGYTEIKDGDKDVDLEVVLLDIKSGQARLSATQRTIERAVRAGKVRFETVRVTSKNAVVHR